MELRSVAVEREVRLGPDHDGKFRAVAALGPELRDGPVRQRVEPGLDLRADLRHRGAASRPALNVIGQFVYGGARRLPRRNRYAAAGDQNQPGSQDRQNGLTGDAVNERLALTAIPGRDLNETLEKVAHLDQTERSGGTMG